MKHVNQANLLEASLHPTKISLLIILVAFISLIPAFSYGQKGKSADVEIILECVEYIGNGTYQS